MSKQKSETNGKTFGFWLNGQEIDETQIEEQIAEVGGSTSAFIKKKLDENKKLRTALQELYDFMSNTMEFPIDENGNPLVSHTDKLFIAKIEKILGVE